MISSTWITEVFLFLFDRRGNWGTETLKVKSWAQPIQFVALPGCSFTNTSLWKISTDWSISYSLEKKTKPVTIVSTFGFMHIWLQGRRCILQAGCLLTWWPTQGGAWHPGTWPNFSVAQFLSLTLPWVMADTMYPKRSQPVNVSWRHRIPTWRDGIFNWQLGCEPMGGVSPIPPLPSS